MYNLNSTLHILFPLSVCRSLFTLSVCRSTFPGVGNKNEKKTKKTKKGKSDSREKEVI